MNLTPQTIAKIALNITRTRGTVVMPNLTIIALTDMPHANRLTVGIMALVAEQEREAISKRTKEALAAAKRRGVKLGNPYGAAALRKAGKGNAAAVASVQEAARQRAEDLQPVIDELQQQGVTGLRAIARALNQRGVVTPRGGKWHPTGVARLLEKIKMK